MLGTGRVFFNLQAQASDIDVNNLIVSVIAFSPDLSQKLLAADGFSGA